MRLQELQTDTYYTWINSEGTFDKLQLHHIGNAVIILFCLRKSIDTLFLLTNNPQLVALQTPFLSMEITLSIKTSDNLHFEYVPERKI